MTGLGNLIKRNCKIFFKDRGMFFTSLITPMILLVLYATFLANVYRDSFMSSMGEGIALPDKIIDALVGGELFSSLLAVSCVTVSFCSNMLMVQDKVTGTRRDLTVSPLKKSTLALSYYIATLISSLIVCYAAAAVCFIYMANVGWYLSAADVFEIILDIFLLVMFGTALSSIINVFLSSQGQISAVGTIISAGYGFICGAYMPISSFSGGIQKAVSLLPGTYGTGILRNAALRGAFDELEKLGISGGLLENIKDGIDCNLYFFGTKVEIPVMYAILAGSVAVLAAAYVVINAKKTVR